MKDLNELWQMVMEDLRKESGATVVDLWLGEVRPVGQEGERLLLWCPSPFKRQKVEEFWMERLKKALFNLFSFEITPVLLREEPAAPAAERAPGRYTFENFVVGPSNRTAWEAARRVAGGERDYCSPLVLYGDPGLGKTHLLRAIEEEALRREPGTRVVRVKGDAFTNDLVDAIRFGEGAAFREKYRTADLLLMDDMQFIAGKKQTQEEFYNTFDALHQNGCAIVVTMDRPPAELERLEKRLLSRFEGG